MVRPHRVVAREGEAFIAHVTSTSPGLAWLFDQGLGCRPGSGPSSVRTTRSCVGVISGRFSKSTGSCQHRSAGASIVRVIHRMAPRTLWYMARKVIPRPLLHASSPTTTDGIADERLRDIATGVGTSHRMSTTTSAPAKGAPAIVAHRDAATPRLLSERTQTAGGSTDVMLGLWRKVSDPALRPYVDLFTSPLLVGP